VPRCAICHQDVERWLPHPHRERCSAFIESMQAVGSDLELYQCPACGCTDRDRHLWMYLRAAGVLPAIAGSRVLHIAPEPHLERLIASLGPALYVRGDLRPMRPGHVRLDVERLPFEGSVFDMIICNHVLEHVDSPQRALDEFHRCLAPAGLLIAQTPFSPRLKGTFEVVGDITAEFAHQFFGQDDHVRLFGADIASHFHNAGFDGQLLQHSALLPDVAAVQWGCNTREPLFAFWKPEQSAAAPAPRSAA